MSEAASGVLSLPPWFWSVPYLAANYPGAVPRAALRAGGNCQLFAYELLALHGFVIPDLRSDDLWSDTSSTCRVSRPQPLDLVLFNADSQPYGAHVGVVVEGDRVLHLCQEVGTPAVWGWQQFRDRPRYSTVVGFKRPLSPAPGRSAP